MSASFYQKENVTLTMRLRGNNKDPWDLTGKRVIAKLMYNGTLTNFDCVTSGSPLIGKTTLILTDEQTALLAVGALDIDLYVGTYASVATPPVIVPASDVTEKIFLIRDVTVLEVQV